MADTPSFFDKNSFFGAVLPGYIAIILVVALFLPQFIPVKMTNDDSFSIDFFTAIVFIIAGPAVGYSVRQFHRYIYTIEEKMPFRKKTKNIKGNKESERERDLRQYAEIRIKASEEEKKELDEAEAGYDFSVSTGIILLAIAIFYMINFQIIFHWINISLIVLSVIFFKSAAFERDESYSPLYFALIKKLNIQ